MNLEKIMSNVEKAVVLELVAAKLRLEAAEIQFHQAEADYRKAREELTHVDFMGRKQNEGTIPEAFVAYFQGAPYLIVVDIEGDHAHRVSRIAGVLGSEPRDK